MLNFAIETARAAGGVLMEKYGRVKPQTKRTDIDLVTEADLASEALILERINTQFPRHSVLAEESGDIAVVGGDGSWKWVIDPLDGTTNFSHGYPIFCVNIALEHDGEIVLGVTYDPTRDEMFACEKGGGATLNGKPIRVSATDDIGSSLLCTGFPYDFKQRDNPAKNLLAFLMASRGVRRDGAAAIDLAYVACGRFDGFWEDGLQPWDVAAGVLMIAEAGGTVSGYDGGLFSIYAPPIVASNGLVHDAMLGVLNG